MMQRRCFGTALVVAAAVGLVAQVSGGSPKPTRVLAGGDSSNGVRVRIGVDPRVELMSIIFRLAGSPAYNQGCVARYNEAIDSHFARFRDHPAIRLARTLRQTNGVSHDAVMSMAIHVEDAYTLKERVPFDRPGSTLDARWRGAEARKFLEAARRFVAESRFREFVQSQQELYDLTSARLRTLVGRQVDFTWFNRFFGTPAGARFVLVPGLANGAGNYGVRVRATDGSEELYAILGVGAVDAAGLPQFDEGMTPTVVHEFNHSYVNPATVKYAARFEKAAARVYTAVADPMREQAYGDWQTMINESLVRAAVARYVLAHRGAEAATEEVQVQRANGFLWTQDLFDLLGDYERERDRYPTFHTFLPRIIEYFDRLAPHIDDMGRRYVGARPQVISMTPENGSEAVDPALSELVFRFDRPMMKTSYSVTMEDKERYPEVLGVGFGGASTIFTMRVQLQPDHLYEFGLDGAFRSRWGVALKMYRVRFRTGPRKP